MRIGCLATAIIAALTGAAGAPPAGVSTAAPPAVSTIGQPLPPLSNLGDDLSNQTPFGQGLLPGAGLCSDPILRDTTPILFPRDDGPHNNVHFEWWWWDGHLVLPDGRRYGFMVYFASKPLQHYQFLDYTLTDLSSGTFHYGRQALIPGTPSVSQPGVSLRGQSAWASGANGQDEIHLTLDGYDLALTMTSLKPAVLQFGDGHFSYYCNSDSYYSRTRMAVIGTLAEPLGAAGAGHAREAAGSTKSQAAERSPLRVTGLGYFEHSWGNLFAIDAANWNDFNLQLDDGRDITLGLVRDRPGGNEFTATFGAISSADGKTTILHRGDFTITPTATWHRDATCSYPVAYAINVHGLNLTIRPSLSQQELRATRWPQLHGLSNTPVYWDGEVIVGGDATGRGYLDMAKYCLA